MGKTARFMHSSNSNGRERREGEGTEGDGKARKDGTKAIEGEQEDPERTDIQRDKETETDQRSEERRRRAGWMEEGGC